MTPSNMLANKSMQAKISVKDIANGYLKIEGAMDGWVEVALFRKKNRLPILVVGETGCGPICGTDLSIYELYRDKMVKTTKNLFPKITEKESKAKYLRTTNGSEEDFYGGVYELPRKGKTIRLVNDAGEDLLFGITWENDKFVVNRSVLDFYYIYPSSEYVSNIDDKDAKVIVNDSKNGYVKIKTKGSTIEFGKFRMTDGTPVFVYAENYCGRPLCVTSDISAKKFVDGKWTDISESVLPDYEEMEKRIQKKSSYARKYGSQYKIPRVGRTIRIVEGEDGKTIYKLVWKNNKFIVVQ